MCHCVCVCVSLSLLTLLIQHLAFITRNVDCKTAATTKRGYNNCHSSSRIRPPTLARPLAVPSPVSVCDNTLRIRNISNMSRIRNVVLDQLNTSAQFGYKPIEQETTTTTKPIDNNNFNKKFEICKRKSKKEKKKISLMKTLLDKLLE